jgi:hypothetical protein
MAIVPIAKVVISPEQIFYDLLYNHLLHLDEPDPEEGIFFSFISGKYIIKNNVMILESWDWDFWGSNGQIYPNSKIRKFINNPNNNQYIEKILKDVAQSITENNFLGYPVKNNQVFYLLVDFQNQRNTHYWHQDKDGSVFIGLVYLPNKKLSTKVKVPAQQITLIIPEQGYSGLKPWDDNRLMITPKMQNCLGKLEIFQKNFYSNEIVFINNLANYHATPTKTNNYLVRFKIKL